MGSARQGKGTNLQWLILAMSPFAHIVSCLAYLNIKQTYRFIIFWIPNLLNTYVWVYNILITCTNTDFYLLNLSMFWDINPPPIQLILWLFCSRYAFLNEWERKKFRPFLLRSCKLNLARDPLGVICQVSAFLTAGKLMCFANIAYKL